MKRVCLIFLYCLLFKQSQAQLTSLSVSTTDAICNALDGALSINVGLVSGTVVTIQVNNALFGAINVSAPIYLNEPVGSYTVIANDGSTTMSTVVSIGQSTPVIVSQTTVTPNTCGCNGQLQVNASGGFPPYTYNINSQTSGSFTNNSVNALCSGFHYILITDSIGCTVDSIINIPQLTTYSLSSNIIQNCNLGTNSVSLSASTGAASPVNYSIQPGNLSGANFTNLAPNNYYVFATDANGCNAYGSFAVNTLNLSTTNSSISCSGTSIVTLNGASSYSVNGVAIAGNTFTANVNTQYNVAGADANGCTGSIFVNVNNPNFTATASFASCNGLSTGSIFAVGGGGTYTLLPQNISNSTGLFSNLSIGTYTISTTTANGCNLTTTAVVNQSPGPQINITTSSCGNIGSLYASPIPNSLNLPYSYTWSNGGNTFCNNNLPTGTYTVVVTDIIGCQNSFISTLAPNSIMTINPIVINSANCNSNSSTYSLMTSGGTPPYTFTTNSVALSINNNIALASNPGTYTIYASDAYGCTISTTLNSLPPIPLSLQISNTAPDTCNQMTGILNIATTGGQMPFDYYYNGVQIPSNNITNLAGGNYLIMVVDANGCSSSTIGAVANFNVITAIYSVQNNWCTNGNAAINFNVTGGTPPFTYSNPNWVNFTTTVSGNYSNTVTDAFGCTKSDNVSVTAKDSMSLKIVRSALGCNTDTLRLESMNPNAIYTLLLPNGSSLNNFTSLIPSVTNSGVYTITESSGIHCNSISTLSYNTVPLNFTTVNTSSSSLLSYDGAISAVLNPINATALFNCSKLNNVNNSFSSNQTFSNLSPGTYGVKVVDANNCSYITTIVANLNLPSGTISGSVYQELNSNCAKDISELYSSNRMVTVNPGNHISFTNATGQFIFNGLPFGNYTVSTSPVHNLLMPSVLPICGNNITATLSPIQPNQNIVFSDSVLPYSNYKINATGGCITPSLASLIANSVQTQVNYGVYSNSPSPFYVNVFGVFDSVQYFGNSIPAHSSISGDTVFWNNLVLNNNNNAWKNIQIYFNYPPATPLGQSQFVSYYINGLLNDVFLTDNISTIDIDICASYDPNDKQVSPPNGYTNLNDSLLSYQIRFQNTGNAPAANVIIRDTLDNDLDITTFNVTAYSHPYTIEVENNNVLVFKFLGILLPDSAADEPGSHGYIAYQILRKQGIAPGTQIQNTANIYFDYNTAIVTNTTSNTYFVEINNISTSKSDNRSCLAPCGTGSVVVNANGGVAPLSYSISPNCANTAVIGNTIQNLKGGNYIITIADAIGYTESVAVSIADPTLLILGTAFTNPSGANNGSITLNVTGGNGPYTYVWNTTNCAGANCYNLAPGTYSVTVSDAYDCTASANFTLAYPTSLTYYNNEVPIKVYPVPSKDLLNIESTQTIGNVYLYNNIGQVVRSLEIGTHGQINLLGLSAGVYTLKMSNGVYKVLVQD